MRRNVTYFQLGGGRRNNYNGALRGALLGTIWGRSPVILKIKIRRTNQKLGSRTG
jgi:hypothetical protein